MGRQFYTFIAFILLAAASALGISLGVNSSKRITNVEHTVSVLSSTAKPIRGPVGPRGPKGNRGPKGKTGRRGPLGKTGQQGKKGNNGNTGRTGNTGAKGSPGARGIPGLDGKPVTPEQIKQMLCDVQPVICSVPPVKILPNIP